MHRGTLAARSAEAQQTISDAARSLARKFKLSKHADAIDEAGHRDPEIARLLEREALAEFLSDLNSRASSSKAGEVDADPYENVKISAQARKALVEAGYTHPAITAGVTDATLDKIDGVADKSIEALRSAYPMSEDLAAWMDTAEALAAERDDMRAQIADLAGAGASDATGETESSTGDSSSSETGGEANPQENESAGE